MKFGLSSLKNITTRGDPLPTIARKLANLLHKCHASVPGKAYAVNAQNSVAHGPINSTMMERIMVDHSGNG